MAYVIFFAAAVGVVMGGALLARAADELAESLRLQRVWIGSVLVAGATSMPELVVDVSAIRVGAPDLAVGDLFGSSMANMLILGILGLAYGHQRLLRSIVPEHALTGTLAISLTMLAVLFILAGPNTAVGPLGIGPVVIAFVYLATIRLVRHASAIPDGSAASTSRGPWVPAAGRFALAAMIILLAGPFLALSADDIVQSSGVDGTLFGAGALAIVTSLPELAASFAAVRLGASDIAVGNLFGSNAYNMLLLLPLDLASGGALLGGVSEANAVAAIAATLMMSAALASIVMREERRIAVLVPDSLLLVGIYFVGLSWVWAAGSG